MSSSASLPSPDDDYAAPLDARLNKAFWDAALNSIGTRIRALEAVKADWEELINTGTGQALAVIQANVEPQLAALTAVINQLKAEVAAAEDAIAVIVAGGVDMSAVTGLADAMAAKASIAALDGAVSALSLSMEGYVSHADEQTLSAEQRARALSNLGLEDIHNTLTPFGFTAAEGQTAFDLGMSPTPNACIVSQNGSWLTGGVDYVIAGSTLTLSTAAEEGDRISGVAIGSFEVANAMLPAANLADLGDKAVARKNLGLGSAATKDTGAAEGDVVQVQAGGMLPALNGSLLTGLALTKYQSSPEIPLVPGGSFSFAHNLGDTPKVILAFYLCKTAELGFPAGALVPIDAGYSYSGRGMSLDVSNQNTIVGRFGSGGAVPLNNFTTGSEAIVTAANWRLILKVLA